MNDEIRAKRVRLIDVDGQQIGIVSSQEALELAEQKDLDLVEVAPDADPPVCRIMDYGKYRYERSKRQKEAKKKQMNTQTKEIKLRPNISPHDYDFKLKHIEKFLQDNHKVKVTIMFSGRQISHKELGENILRNVIERMKDLSDVEYGPKMEGPRNMITMLTPKHN
ncbi:MAG: translation initiation factor IF-3 [bacterium]